MTMTITQFRIERPRDIAGALAARLNHENSSYLAGGTDLLVNLRHGINAHKLLIDLSGIEELTGIDGTGDGLRIGSAVTITALAKAPLAEPYRAITQAACAIAGPGHRVLATVGGNLCLDTRCVYYNQSEWWRQANGYCLKRRGDICHVAPQGERCHAAFTGDLAPALMVLGAQVEIAGAQGRRRIPLADLYREDGRDHLTLAAGEIVVALHLPAQTLRSAYRKVRLRGAIDYPLAGVAVALAVKNGKLAALKVGLTGTNSRPLLLTGTDALCGKPLGDEQLQAVNRLVQKQVQPMRTTMASANYRRLAAAALAQRMVAELAATEGAT